MPTPLFKDRRDAGQQLARTVRELHLDTPLVLALPRGGVPVAREVADALDAPLDLVLVRKLGVPGQPELAFGAVVDGVTPHMVLNEDIVAAAHLGADDINSVMVRELAEIDRRRKLYFGDRAPSDPKGRDVVVVDDGLATGATARAALEALRRAGARELVLAVPLAPAETLQRLAGAADTLVCLEAPYPFRGVGAWYGAFPQLTDADVQAELQAPA